MVNEKGKDPMEVEIDDDNDYMQIIESLLHIGQH